MGRATGSEPVAVLRERRVPAALQDLQDRLLDQAIQHGGDAELAHPSVRLGDFDSPHRLRLVSPVEQLFPDGLASAHAGSPGSRRWSCHRRRDCPGWSGLVATPLRGSLVRTPPPSETSPVAGLSGPRFAAGDSVPSRAASGVSPRLSVMKASGSCRYWIFGRMSPMSREAYWPLHRSGLRPLVPGRASPGRFSPFGWSVPLEQTDGFDLLCPLLTSAPRSGSPHGSLSPSSA